VICPYYSIGPSDVSILLPGQVEILMNMLPLQK